MRIYFSPVWTTKPWTPAARLFDRYFPRQFHGKHRAVTK